MKKHIAFAVVFAVIAGVALAEEGGLEQVESPSRWTFSAGPAWRNSMDVDFSGSRSIGFQGTGTGYENGHVGAETVPGSGTTLDWSGPTQEVPDPSAPGSNMSILQLIGRENAGGTVNGNGSDDDYGFGVTLSAGYDFYSTEMLKFGLGLRFAGYWNMQAEINSDAGTVSQVRFRDTYLFPNWVDGDPTPSAGTDSVNTTPMGGNYSREIIGGGSTASTFFSGRVRSDLYQIGLGPKLTWSPFVGWFQPLSWLDIYGSVEVLCNISRARLEADGGSASSTDCLLGFGGNVGLVGNITDWCGIYGQVGYEWVDKTDVSVNNFKADIDYASLVVSAGVQFRF